MDAAELLVAVATPVAIVEPGAERLLVTAASGSFRCMMGHAGDRPPDLAKCNLRFDPESFQRALVAADAEVPEGSPSYAVAEGSSLSGAPAAYPFASPCDASRAVREIPSPRATA